MPFVLPDPEGLAPEVYPLAWLVGRGAARVSSTTPASTRRRSRRRSSSTTTAARTCRTRRPSGSIVAPTDDRGARATTPPAPVWPTESGYWRVPPERPTDWGLTDDQHPVELLVADPSGHVAAVHRRRRQGSHRPGQRRDRRATATGAEVSAGKRLYGLVNGELMWAHDIAAFGHPHAVLRLRPPRPGRGPHRRRGLMTTDAPVETPTAPRRAAAARQPPAGPPRRGRGLRARRRRRLALRRPDGRAARAVAAAARWSTSRTWAS